MKEERNPENEPVEISLPRILGLRPGVYLTVLYGAVLFAILFYLLLLPGINNRGEVLHIDSVPSGAAIFVDGTYRGASPAKIFAAEGTRTVSLEKKGYQFNEENLDIGGQLVGSRFFPRRRDISFEFHQADTDRIWESLFLELSRYALIDSYRENYQAPPLIQSTVEDMLAADLLDTESLYEKLFSLLPNIGNETMLHDFFHAWKLVKAREDEYFSSEKEALSRLIEEASEAESVEPGLLELAFGKAEDPLLVQTDYLYKGIPGGTIISEEEGDETLSGSIQVQRLRFSAVNGAIYTMGNPERSEPVLPFSEVERDTLPAGVRVDSFFVATRELTVGDWRAFIEAVPQWSPENREALAEEHLVDSEYLSDWSAGGTFSQLPDNQPLSGVSYYAALAYCSWLSGRLPDSMSEDWEVRLPSEAEWELAALRNGDTPAVFADTAGRVLPADFQRQGRLAASDFSGNLWEWTGEWYFPLSRIYVASGGGYRIPDSYRGAEVIVRGGSWANRSDMVAVYSSGSQDPTWCTPFLGFRPVMARKESRTE
jgi:gamma-glutamyl hercynylcysteine S-oxide synthase